MWLTLPWVFVYFVIFGWKLTIKIQRKESRRYRFFFFFPEGCWTIFRKLPWKTSSLLRSSAVDVLCSLFCFRFFLRSLGLFLSLQILMISSSDLDRGCNQIFYFVRLPTFQLSCSRVEKHIWICIQFLSLSWLSFIRMPWVSSHLHSVVWQTGREGRAAYLSPSMVLLLLESSHEVCSCAATYPEPRLQTWAKKAVWFPPSVQYQIC